MTLEDFFTLTEMKDGLTAPSRVEELVKLMQTEKDSGVNNAGEATRHWVAVASTIAATENKDCLDLFIQLDGVLFVDKWLKDAQSLVSDTNESFVEDSITAMLRALEKLQIDNKRSTSTGIWSTVEKLLDHKSLKVRDLARLLFDSWKQNGEARSHDDVNTGVLCGDDSSELSMQESISIYPSRVVSNSENHPSGTAQVEKLPTSSLEGLQPESADVQIPTCNKQSQPDKLLEIEDQKDSSPDALCSKVIQQSPIKEESSLCTLGANSLVGCSNVLVAKMSRADLSDGPELSVILDNEKENNTIDDSPKNLGVTDISSESVHPLESEVVCSNTDAATIPIYVNASFKSADVKEEGSCQKLEPLSNDGQHQVCVSDSQVVKEDTTVTKDTAKVELDDTTVMMDDTRSVDHCNTLVQDSDCSKLPLELSGNGSLSGKVEDRETSGIMDNSGAVDEDEGETSDEEQESDESEELAIANVFPRKDVFTSSLFEKRRSDIDVEYGMVDALEVARQVAQEVEREVVGYREPTRGSSSGKSAGDGIQQPGSPDSINEKQDSVTKVAPVHVPVAPVHVPVAPVHVPVAPVHVPVALVHVPVAPVHVPVAQVHSVEANPKDIVEKDDQDMRPEHSTHDMESSQVTETAQEAEANSRRGFCGFDLNEEVSSDEMDFSANPVSTPIPLPRPLPAADLPAAPLQFEGAIGLKGSVGNSAFRRASPRKFLQSEKNLSAGATTESSKQRSGSLCLDLNVAVGVDDLEKQIPLSFGQPSEESAGEVSQSRLGRPNLDLNRIDDDGDALPLNLRVEGQFLFNRISRRSPSPASSSSMQPLTRNFDLNDRPFFLNDSIDQGHGKSPQSAAYRGQLDGSAISIMGTRVEIKRNDVPHTFPLSNGKSIIDIASDSNLARAGSPLELGSRVSYANNGLPPGPTMSFTSTLYGPGGAIPYMMDSRGSPVPVMPQGMGSASVALPPFSPYIMNMNGMQLGLNGAGPSQPSLDLNSGFMVESGSRDSGLRQFFGHGQGGSIDDHLRISSQPPSSSNVGQKRKEPEAGWEPYPSSYRHQQPPWR